MKLFNYEYKIEYNVDENNLKDVIVDKHTVYCYFNDGWCLEIQKHYLDNDIDLVYDKPHYIGYYTEYWYYISLKKDLGAKMVKKIEEKIAIKYKKDLKLRDIIMKGVM